MGKSIVKPLSILFLVSTLSSCGASTFLRNHLDAPNVSLTKTGLSWDSIEGADYYEVYDARSGTLLERTISSSCRLSDLVEDTEVYVVACQRQHHFYARSSSPSNRVTIAGLPFLPAPALVESYGDGLHWSPVDGADYYEIYDGVTGAFLVSTSKNYLDLPFDLSATSVFVRSCYAQKEAHGLRSAPSKTVAVTSSVPRMEEIIHIGPETSAYTHSQTSVGSIVIDARDTPLTINVNADVFGGSLPAFSAPENMSALVTFHVDGDFHIVGGSGMWTNAPTPAIQINNVCFSGPGSLELYGGFIGSATQAKYADGVPALVCVTADIQNQLTCYGSDGQSADAWADEEFRPGNGGDGIITKSLMLRGMNAWLKAYGGNGGSSIGVAVDGKAGLPGKNRDGGLGQNGQDGKNGGDGGTALKAERVLVDDVTKSSTFQGGKGGNGGNGGNGGDGGRGGDAEGSFVGRGSRGGNAGSGGNGGNSGMPGYGFEIGELTGGVSWLTPIIGSLGKPGNGGNGGNGGEGGMGNFGNFIGDSDGGTGGNGGNGGAAGKCLIRNGEAILNGEIYMPYYASANTARPGREGSAGIGGAPGENAYGKSGKSGQKGLDGNPGISY